VGEPVITRTKKAPVSICPPLISHGMPGTELGHPRREAGVQIPKGSSNLNCVGEEIVESQGSYGNAEKAGEKEQ